MKVGTLLTSLLLLTLTSRAQDAIPTQADELAKQQARRVERNRPALGLDLIPIYYNIVAIGDGNVPGTYARSVSVTLYLPARSNIYLIRKRKQAVYINAGYTAYGGIRQRTIYQKGSGLHVRAGVDYSVNDFIWGGGGIASVWSGRGSYVFNGSYFGVYQQDIGRRDGVAFGFEGHAGMRFTLTNRLSLRALVRLSALVCTANSENLLSPRLSGVELATLVKPSFAVGLNPQANLAFRL